MGGPEGTLDISGIRGMLNGEDVLIVGSGQSLETAGLDLDCNFFFVGDSFLRTDAWGRRNFYVRANSEFPNLNISTHRDLLQVLDCTWIFARSVKESEAAVVHLLTQHQKSVSFTFDQRHFHGEACRPRGSCCDDIEAANQTLQEQIADMVGLDYFYSEGATVAIHALAIAILAGAKKVRLVGVEIPLFQSEYRYAKAMKNAPIGDSNSTSNITLNFYHYFNLPAALARLLGAAFNALLSWKKRPSVFAPDFASIISDFQYLVDAGKQVNCEVEICSSNSNLRKLNGVRTVR